MLPTAMPFNSCGIHSVSLAGAILTKLGIGEQGNRKGWLRLDRGEPMADEGIIRGLSAILATDIAGYTRLKVGAVRELGKLEFRSMNFPMD